MDRLLVFALVGMLSSTSFAAIDNFQELIDTSAKEQSEAYSLVNKAAARPLKRSTKLAQKNSDFKIRLVKVPWKKRTMVAESSKK